MRQDRFLPCSARVSAFLRNTQAQQAVNDSIEAFVKEYNKTRGYDAILLKNATLFINPDLDITNEIVEGLNARYNKVTKK